MAERVDDQITYHESRSKSNQTWFRRLRFIEILAAASIPFLTGYVTESFVMQILVGLLGVLIAVVTGTMTLYNFEQNWATSRNTIENLRHEKILFETSSEPYHADQSFPLFVEKIETLLASERDQWFARMQERQKQAAQQPAEPQDDEQQTET